MFLGYLANHRGFRCLDLSSNKIILSRHVRFDEDVFPFASLHQYTSQHYDFLNTTHTIPLPIHPITTVGNEAPITDPPTPNPTETALTEPIIQPTPLQPTTPPTT